MRESTIVEIPECEFRAYYVGERRQTASTGPVGGSLSAPQTSNLLLRGEEGGKGKREGEWESPQPHFLATPLRGGIEGQGWEREEGRGEGGSELGAAASSF